MVAGELSARLVLGQKASQAVHMLGRQVAFNGLRRSVFQQCRFDYTVYSPNDTDKLTHNLYVPRVSYRNGGEEATHLLTNDGRVLRYTHAWGGPLPPVENDPDVMARRLEWLGDAAWFHPSFVTVDARAREQEREHGTQ